MLVLFCPPPGAPAHTLAGHFDAGSPRWTPRAPTVEEEAKIRRIGGMQALVDSQLGEED